MRLSFLTPALLALMALLAVVEANEALDVRATSKRPSNVSGSRKSHPQKMMATTCSRFRDACVKAALAGKSTGRHAIVYDCYKKAPKNTQYHFNCRIGRKDYTQKALRKFSGGTTSTSYTAVSTTTKTISTETDLTSTTATFSSTETDTETATTTDDFSTTTTTTVDETATVPETTVESFTIAETSTPSVPTTIVLTNTVTTTSTSTSYSSVGDIFPVIDYQIVTTSPARRAARLDGSSFCKAYSSACSRQCARVNSTPKHQVCQQKSGGRVSLSCVCKNKKLETQHALADIGDDQHVSVVSTIATSSATATVTSTMVIPTTVVATETTTSTSHVPVTSTIVSTVTSTGTVTATATSSTTSTASETATVTVPVVTTTVTETATAVASTIVVIAPTGVVKATYANGEQPRYVSRQDTTNRGLNTLVLDSAQAEPVMMVYDAPTNTYALQYVTGGLYLSCEVGTTMTTGTYGFFVSAAGRAAGPSGGAGPWQGRSYESYCFSVAANSITQASIPIQAVWIQPDGTKFNPVYISDNGEDPNRYIIVAGMDGQFGTDLPTVTMALIPQA